MTKEQLTEMFLAQEAWDRQESVGLENLADALQRLTDSVAKLNTLLEADEE